MLLIGCGYKSRQGKDSTCNVWKEALPELKIYSFGKILKEYCRDHHDELEPKWQLAHQTKQKPVWKDDPIYGCTPILQWYGTDVVRATDPNRWVNELHAQLEADKPEAAVISDVRFLNEANYVKENGGYMVELVRVNEDGTRYLCSKRDPNHRSETELDNYLGWDFIIRAKSGDMKGLSFKALGVLASIINDYKTRTVTHIPDATGNSSSLPYYRSISDWDEADE